MPGPRSGGGAPTTSPAESKRWITLYPIYFDAKRSHKDGERRVGWSLSSLAPQSIAIARALERLGGLRFVHEPAKTHPRDWENPGRVKVQLFRDDEGKEAVSSKYKNRKQLLLAVAPLVQQFGGGKPPGEKPPKREKARRKGEKRLSKKEGAAAVDGEDKRKGKAVAGSKATAAQKGKKAGATSSNAAAAASSSTAAPKPRRLGPLMASAGSSSRSARVFRKKALRPHLPPAQVRLPPHSPAVPADLLNMDLGAMAGGAGAGLPGAPGGGAGGAANPMGALGSMMGNLGFGGDDDEEDKQEDQQQQQQRGNDPFRGMGRRGRKRVVRVGR